MFSILFVNIFKLLENNLKCSKYTVRVRYMPKLLIPCHQGIDLGTQYIKMANAYTLNKNKTNFCTFSRGLSTFFFLFLCCTSSILRSFSCNYSHGQVVYINNIGSFEICSWRILTAIQINIHITKVHVLVCFWTIFNTISSNPKVKNLNSV